MRLSGGGEVRGARRRPAGRRTQSVVMGYDPHALESDAESPALARGRLGQSSGDLVDSSWPCVRRELVLGGESSSFGRYCRRPVVQYSRARTLTHPRTVQGRNFLPVLKNDLLPPILLAQQRYIRQAPYKTALDCEICSRYVLPLRIRKSL